MISVLLFPQFDPVIVQVGPFAIRWYALAYITGLVLGWRPHFSLVHGLELFDTCLHQSVHGAERFGKQLRGALAHEANAQGKKHTVQRRFL